VGVTRQREPNVAIVGMRGAGKSTLMSAFIHKDKGKHASGGAVADHSI